MCREQLSPRIRWVLGFSPRAEDQGPPDILSETDQVVPVLLSEDTPGEGRVVEGVNATNAVVKRSGVVRHRHGEARRPRG